MDGFSIIETIFDEISELLGFEETKKVFICPEPKSTFIVPLKVYFKIYYCILGNYWHPEYPDYPPGYPDQKVSKKNIGYKRVKSEDTPMKIYNDEYETCTDQKQDKNDLFRYLQLIKPMVINSSLILFCSVLNRTSGVNICLNEI